MFRTGPLNLETALLARSIVMGSLSRRPGVHIPRRRGRLQIGVKWPLHDLVQLEEGARDRREAHGHGLRQALSQVNVGADVVRGVA